MFLGWISSTSAMGFFIRYLIRYRTIGLVSGAIHFRALLFFRRAASLVSNYLRLVIQHRVQERTVNLDLAVIANESELAKLVHEKADAGARGADHFCQRLLADMGRDRLRGAFLAEICQQQEKAREPLLAR